MDKPSKCKNCQWYGKPYWSIIDPCDNCPLENVEIFTRWIDPTIEEYKKEIDRLNNIINSLEKWLKGLIENFNEDVSEPILHEQMTINLVYDYLENLKELKENKQ